MMNKLFLNWLRNWLKSWVQRSDWRVQISRATDWIQAAHRRRYASNATDPQMGLQPVYQEVKQNLGMKSSRSTVLKQADWYFSWYREEIQHLRYSFDSTFILLMLEERDIVPTLVTRSLDGWKIILEHGCLWSLLQVWFTNDLEF